MKKTIIIFTIIAISLGMATFTTKHFKAQVLSYGSILEKNIVALCDGEDNIPSGFVKVRGQWKGYCWKPTITDSCQCPIDSNCTIKVIQYLKNMSYTIQKLFQIPQYMVERAQKTQTKSVTDYPALINRRMTMYT